jgi:hypothetical protein
MKLSRLARSLFVVSVAVSPAAASTGCIKGVMGGGTTIGATAGDGDGTALSAGGGDTGGGGDAQPMAPKPDKPGTIDPSAPPGVQELWKKLVAIHQTATAANAEATGKAIWAVMDSEFHANVARGIGDMLRRLKWDKLGVKLELLTYRVLGAAAVEHANEVVGGDIEVKMRSRDDGSVTAEIGGHYNGNRISDFEARDIDGEWLFRETGAFLARAGDSFRSDGEVARPQSIEALAAAWTKVLASGTGKQLWDLMSAGTHTQLLSDGDNIQGFGKASAIEVLEASLLARRAKQLAVTKHEIDGKEITFTYSDGTTETLEAGPFGDDWFMEM